MFVLMAVLFVLSSGLSVTASPKAEDANDQYIGAAEIYAYPNTATGIKKLMGRRVKFECIVKLARAVPVVEIVAPDVQSEKRSVSVHVISIGTTPGDWKLNQRLTIKGIIVDQGFNAYMVYLHEVESSK